MRDLSLIAKWRKAFVIGMTTAIALLWPLHFVWASAPFLAVNDIRPGMHGIARTIVAGTKMEEFNVEVLGIMKNKGPSGDLILVRVSGDVIDRTGGIAQGMSGSPVYIDGKLVGAIAYGWSLTDHRVGMVTPIGDMLKIWDLNKPAAALQPEVQSPEKAPVPGKTEPLATPLMVSGFGPQAMAMLTEKLKPMNLIPYAVGDAPAGITYSPLEPGSAVGVELVRGDVSIGALGTVTYVDDGRVLAFGHPFLNKGATQFLMTNAYIFTTVSGLENSFKVGITGEPVGILNQDRGAGVAGKIGQYPGIIPVRMTVKDEAIGRTGEYAVQVVNDEQLSPVLAATTLLSQIEKTADRTGPGTAKVSFEISAAGLPDGVLKRDNIFFSPVNINEAAVMELFEAMSIMASNQFQALDVMDVAVHVSVSDNRRTAAIIQSTPAVTNVKPGDQVAIAVKLKPYRGEQITRTVNVTVPKNQPQGQMMLEVRGGGIMPLAQLLRRQSQEEDLRRIDFRPKYKTLEEQIQDFKNRDRNNDLVVEIVDNDFDELGDDLTRAKPNSGKSGDDKPRPNSDTTAKKPGLINNPPADSAFKKTDEKRKFSTTTDYVIDGLTQVMLQVGPAPNTDAKTKK